MDRTREARDGSHAADTEAHRAQGEDPERAGRPLHPDRGTGRERSAGGRDRPHGQLCDDPQRTRRARRDGLPGAAAPLRRTGAHRPRLPALRRLAALPDAPGGDRASSDPRVLRCSPRRRRRDPPGDHAAPVATDAARLGRAHAEPARRERRPGRTGRPRFRGAPAGRVRHGTGGEADPRAPRGDRRRGGRTHLLRARRRREGLVARGRAGHRAVALSRLAGRARAPRADRAGRRARFALRVRPGRTRPVRRRGEHRRRARRSSAGRRSARSTRRSNARPRSSSCCGRRR